MNDFWTGKLNDPYAFQGTRYPEMGVREKELERNAP